MNFDIKQLEMLNERPHPDKMPGTPWTHECKLGDKYQGAFDAENQEAADIWLLMLVGHSLRYGHILDTQSTPAQWRRMTWREAFEYERDELAWFAFSIDVTRTAQPGIKVELKDARDFAAKHYKAHFPVGVTSRKDEDILERVHSKRAKVAKARGEVYWRKSMPIPNDKPQQGGLFE